MNPSPDRKLPPALDPLPCPHCARETFARDQVMHLGPALSVACSACGGRVSVPWSGGMRFLGEFLGPVCVLAAVAFLLSGERMAHLSVPPVVVLILVLIPAGILFAFAARRYRSRLRLVKR